jgi:hypothetical protein
MDRRDRLTKAKREAIFRELNDGWRMRCPHGHASLKDNDGPTVYCGTCDGGYHYTELIDASETRTLVVSPPGCRYDDN